MTKSAAQKARIEVFRTGTFTPMEGPAISYSAADLRAVADNYDATTAPAPVVIGHPTTDAPAFGWAESFDFDSSTGILHATVGEIVPAFSEAVNAGRYKKVSLQFHRPESSSNPVPGAWYPKHIGFLGGMAPAVPGLKNVQFAGNAAESVTFTSSFGDRGFEETAGILRMLREFFIERFGMDEADKALPAYRLEWLSEATSEPSPRPAFATPQLKPLQETFPVTNPNPAFAEQEANLKTREAALAKRLTDLAHTDNVSFADGLVSSGRLIATSRDRLVAVLDALPSEATVSFAAGEAAVPPAKAIRDILEAQPKVVSFGRSDLIRADLAVSGRDAPVSFAADGKQVDAGQLETHEKALAYQRAHPGTDFIAAVHAVS